MIYILIIKDKLDYLINELIIESDSYTIITTDYREIHTNLKTIQCDDPKKVFIVILSYDFVNNSIQKGINNKINNK